jgi:2'-hydroxyisoflavone reductase
MDRRKFIARAAGTAGALGVGIAGIGDVRARERAFTAEPARAPLRILILGGTGFIGPHQVRAARDRGHTLTLFNRGRTNPGLFPDIETLNGDRNGDLRSLEGRRWDCVIDNSGFEPAQVKLSAALLKNSVKQYLFVSTQSVYASRAIIDQDEGGAVGQSGVEEQEWTGYGPLKARCERELREAMPKAFTIVRPAVIVGPGDASDRFTYWVQRIDRGGEVLAPGLPDDPTQFIDVRDLCEWTIRLVENGTMGMFNATGPGSPLSVAGLMYGLRAVTTSPVSFTWTSHEFLAAQKVRPFSDLPLWMVPAGATAGFMRMSARAAKDAGLTYRPLATTAADTLAWWKTEPAERRNGRPARGTSGRARGRGAARVDRATGVEVTGSGTGNRCRTVLGSRCWVPVKTASRSPSRDATHSLRSTHRAAGTPASLAARAPASQVDEPSRFEIRSMIRIRLALLGPALFASPALSHGQTAPCLTATPACTEWVAPVSGSGRSLVYRNFSLEARNPAITRVLVSIHGAGRDADNYYRSTLAAAFLAGALENTLIISPRMASNDGAGCRDSLATNEISWHCNTWRSGGPSLTHPTATSFDFLDAVLRQVARKELFPNVRAIVVTGHSAGGQVVNRYGMSNQVHDKLGVPVTYIVSNPSSYAYPDSDRPTNAAYAITASAPGYIAEVAANASAFRPFGDTRNCTTYDQWPFGFKNRTGYSAKQSDEQVKRQLASRPTIYLLGGLDILPLGGFDGSCAAMAQGPTRLARGQAYARYVNEKLGGRHTVTTVGLCGHNARCMLTSEQALPLLFPK